MKQMKFLPLFLALALGCATATVKPNDPVTSAQTAHGDTQSTRLETADFKDIAKKVISLGEAHGFQHVLLVVDVDNTTLVMDKILGSEQWFDWQVEKLEKNDPVGRLADSFPKLVEKNNILLNRSSMHLVQEDLAEIFKDLQKRGVHIFALTSRAGVTAPGTIRELKKNGLRLDQNPINSALREKGQFLPYDIHRIQEIEMTPEEAKSLNLGPARRATFSEGVFYTSGQHKGAMLRAIMARSRQDYKAVVFVDNKQKYSDQVRDALATQKVELVTVRYSRTDKEVEDFKVADKTLVIQQTEALKKELLQK